MSHVSNVTELRAPFLMVAMPQLQDPNFHHGVVLILEHNPKGSMGLVLNRPTTLSMATFCVSQKMPCKKNPMDLIFQGGPVHTDRAFILHASSHKGPETEPVFEDIQLSYSLESLTLLTETPPELMRVFLGYAGWGADQLSEEIAEGSWLVTEPTSDFIFKMKHDALWNGVLESMGVHPMQLVHSGKMH